MFYSINKSVNFALTSKQWSKACLQLFVKGKNGNSFDSLFWSHLWHFILLFSCTGNLMWCHNKWNQSLILLRESIEFLKYVTNNWQRTETNCFICFPELKVKVANSRCFWRRRFGVVTHAVKQFFAKEWREQWIVKMSCSTYCILC